MFYTGRKCTPQTTRKRYVWFINQLLIFLVLFIVDATVFILLGGYLDLLDLTLQFEWLVEKFNENIQYLEKQLKETWCWDILYYIWN